MSEPEFESFELPIFEIPQEEHASLSWEAVMRETRSMRIEYLRNFDDPEERLRNKNPEPFVIRITPEES